MDNSDAPPNHLIIYGIPGLGADKRVFAALNLHCTFISLEWIQPEPKEPLRHYALRLSKQMDTSAPFAILGLSFGGLIAVELSKVLKPELTFLVSSVETYDELPLLYRCIGETGIAKWIPKKLFIPPPFVARYLFGTKNGDMLNSMLHDTDPTFTKWAVNSLLNWKSKERIPRVVSIHGTADKLIPWKGKRKGQLIEKGTHFMIVDRAEEVSRVINQLL